jgi:hypothetical protein
MRALSADPFHVQDPTTDGESAAAGYRYSARTIDEIDGQLRELTKRIRVTKLSVLTRHYRADQDRLLDRRRYLQLTPPADLGEASCPARPGHSRRW